ncbi:protoporphyrinogen oxidase [Rhizobium sp. Root274]|uniref:flavodoxin domain-containing protein n=1 Tax=unclassified Rhizobium TaxID=2613769 RepID=UPI000715D4B3|nr:MULTISPECIES: flavodoxin domain-containing protein [unclassified Rhizobium]KQW27512.1 protoporphyrinogen oxidase [Rhizobium sp. Root1240]KRD27748.1 protoporphyrinogen oxidase [Rhizobium sp. Root274]
MIILVGYATVEGQSRRIAETIAADIEAAGDRALLFDIGLGGEYAVGHPEAAILCAPIHAARYPASFVAFVRQEASWLNSVPSAFVSVTLLIRSELEEEREEARHFPGGLLSETGWAPGLVHHAAGALRYSEYDFFKRWMMKRLAGQENAPTDVSRDHEFTDWEALAAFVEDFRVAAKT